MKLAGFIVFLGGLFIASGYAAHALSEAEIRAAAGVAEAAEISPGDRISAWASEAGLAFVCGLGLMVAGAAAARRAGRRRTGGDGAAEGAKGGPETTPLEQLRHMAGQLRDLPQGKTEEYASAIQGALDELLEEDIPELLEQREEMIEQLGLARFAEMIGAFASMERNVARAWSAITDEAWAEVEPCLAHARVMLDEAIERYAAAAPGEAAPPAEPPEPAEA